MFYLGSSLSCQVVKPNQALLPNRAFSLISVQLPPSYDSHTSDRQLVEYVRVMLHLTQYHRVLKITGIHHIVDRKLATLRIHQWLLVFQYYFLYPSLKLYCSTTAKPFPILLSGTNRPSKNQCQYVL